MAINYASKPLKNLSDCNTRWLSIQPAVENIIAEVGIKSLFFNCMTKCEMLCC